MGITANFDFNAINKHLSDFQNRIILAQIQTLKYLGELCVIRARSIPASIGFNDQTGNLRSSIGYVVFVDGIEISSDFNEILNGSQGVLEGKTLAYKVGQENNEGLVLVVVAGMNYALAVESKGKDVLTSTEHYAIQALPSMLNDLKINIMLA